MDKDFFVKQTASSRIKASIVAEYFPQYSKIILKRPQTEIRYLDLFAGPGMYDDGMHSTPLLIAKACADDSRLRNTVRLLFNDKQYSEQLESNFYSNFPNGTFAKQPSFGNQTVGESKRIQEYLTREPIGSKNPYPTLLFFDPWGYKGIDTLALAKFMEHWGNEIFLFVNIKRIHAAVENNKFDDLMLNLFPTTIDKIRRDRRYAAVHVHERLSLIMANLAAEFKAAVKGTLFSCAFKFQEEDSNATSHFIIHFTKHPKGYELIKQIYHSFDNIGASLEKEGTYTFDAKKMDKDAIAFLDFGDTNIAKLSEQLSYEYKGRTISARKLFEEHHPKEQYSGKHYLTTLRKMYDRGKIEAYFNDDSSHNVSVLLNDNCILTFK